MTAKDLLHKYLEYACDWYMHEEYSSSTLRLQQILSLLEALELTRKYADPNTGITYFRGKGQQTRAEYLAELTDLEYFVQGEFFHDRTEEANKEIINRAIETVIGNWQHLQDFRNKPVEAGGIFGDLLSFRIDVYRLIHSGGMMMEGFSVGFAYCMHLRHKLIKTLEENLEEIDETLSQLIDPQKRDIPLETMVTQFNYPDVDLGEHDRQFRFDTF